MHCRHTILLFPLERNAAISVFHQEDGRNATQRKKGGRTLVEGDEGDSDGGVVDACDDGPGRPKPSQARTRVGRRGQRSVKEGVQRRMDG